MNRKCDVIFSETIVDNAQNCPAGYQAETCTCLEQMCNGAKFDGDVCVSSTGKVPKIKVNKTKWTYPQLSIMIIYNSTWSILIQSIMIFCRMTI